MDLRDTLQRQVTEDAQERAKMAEHLGALVEDSTMRALNRFFQR